MSDENITNTEPAATPPVIRGLRAMAIVRWVLLIAVALVAAGTWWVYVVSSDAEVQGPDKYYCPMHPQIRSPVPGTCPICFMKLEPIPEERTGSMPLADAGHPSPPEPGGTPAGLVPVMLTLERRQTVGIATTQASRRSVSRELRLAAVIEAPEGAVSEVRVRTAGFVERVASVETGARVRAGQPLLWIYAPEILRAEEELLTARRLRATDQVTDGGESGQHELGDRVSEAARQRLLLLGVDSSDVARVLEQGRTDRLVPIRAPSSGVVTARHVAVGTQATPDMMLFQVTDLSRVWASATVSAEDQPSIPVGAKGRFFSRTGGRTYDVEATLVEPRVATETRTARIRFLAKNPDVSLLPGRIGEVVVSLPAQEYVLVPRDAVVDVGHYQYAFVEQSAGLFAPRVIQAGPLIGDERAIVRGVEAGERVVSRGAFVLDSESRLQAAVAPRPTDGGVPSTPAAPSHEHMQHGEAP